MQTQANSPSFYSCPFSEDISAVFIEPDPGFHFTNVLLSSPYLAQCWGLLEGRRQQRGAFSRPSFQQSHRTKARVQCSGPSGKGIERKEEQMAQRGLGEEDSASAEPPLHAHFSWLPSPHGGSSQDPALPHEGQNPTALGAAAGPQATLPGHPASLPPFSQFTCGQMKLTEAHFVKSLTVQTLWCPVRYKVLGWHSGRVLLI